MFLHPSPPFSHIPSDQIPPDLVVKYQAIDIVEVIFSLVWQRNIVQTSCRNRKSRCELLSLSGACRSTTKSGRMWKKELEELIDAGIHPEDLAATIHGRMRDMPGLILGSVPAGGNFPIKLPNSLRDRHCYIIGRSGSGKQTPPTPCLPQRALKPTVLDWRKSLGIHDGLLTCRRPHLPLGGLVTRRADTYRVRSA